MSKWFHHYGKFCATHPWEVIVLVVASTVYLFTIEQSQTTDSIKSNHQQQQQQQQQQCIGCLEEQFKAVDVVVMTIIRCCAILYSLHQFRNLQAFDSKYILGIAGIFPVISSFVYTTTALNFLKITFVDLKDAIFFFLLSSDLTKAATLAQFATTAATQDEISTNIAIGMSILGPTITLDTIVETLVIGVGTLSGVQRLEMLSYFACLAVLVNYIIFMTFYPACLSLMLELMRIWNCSDEKQQQLTKKLLENEKVNAAVQRVKIIMSIGLTVVHIHSRWWYLKDNEIDDNDANILISDNTNFGFIMRQFALNADHIVILVLVITLIMKFVFFENDVHLKTVKLIKHDSETSQSSTINNEKQVQTINNEDTNLIVESRNRRNLEECLEIYRSKGATYLSDCEIILLVDTKHIPAYNLEKILKNEERAVKIRRQIVKIAANCETAFINIPYQHYDYSKVMDVCCENVIGYIPVPLGIAGPLRLDDKHYYIPMSTTEGCLVASTNRGCRAVEYCGIKSQILGDGMTRGPVVRFNSALETARVAYWLKKSCNFDLIKSEFDSTSRYARLIKVQTCVAGRYLYLRFVAETGDAMGMNMLSKGTEKALIYLQKHFPTIEILSLSGNYCTDKKAAAINWIEGRGKSVVCETIISRNILTTVLKTSAKALVDLHIAKNLIGSAMAGSIGGFNAHAANIVTAIFIATGQDPAQNITSSNCLTLFEECGENGQDLRVSCTMPSIELGTIGGGTILSAQSACLEMLGIKGPHEHVPGDNARQLAKIVCATVLAGELSLMAALTTGDLVKSHLKHNRAHAENDSSCEVVLKD